MKCTLCTCHFLLHQPYPYQCFWNILRLGGPPPLTFKTWVVYRHWRLNFHVFDTFFNDCRHWSLKFQWRWERLSKTLTHMCDEHGWQSCRILWFLRHEVRYVQKNPKHQILSDEYNAKSGIDYQLPNHETVTDKTEMWRRCYSWILFTSGNNIVK